MIDKKSKTLVMQDGNMYNPDEIHKLACMYWELNLLEGLAFLAFIYNTSFEEQYHKNKDGNTKT